MAKKRKNWNEYHAQRREIALWQHITDLGLATTDDYLKWCAEHGFRARITKGLMSYRQELRHFKKERALKHMKQARSLKNMLGVIVRMCHGEITLRDIANSEIENICLRVFDAFPRHRDRLLLCEFLAFVDHETNLLEKRERIGQDDVYYVHALISVYYHRKQWGRPYREWRTSTHNYRRQFNSLWRYLLASYPTPDFFDNVWFDQGRRGRKDQQWIITIGQGKSVRSELAPLPLNARMAHEFLLAPATCNLLQALRWAQVSALGGNKALYEAFLRSRVGRTRAHNEFWVTVIQFFITHSDLAIRHVGPVVDYLQTQKFATQNLQLFCGAWQTTPPPHPDLTLKGRTPTSLLKKVNRWHTVLGGRNAGRRLTWKPTNIGNHSMLTGKNKTLVRWRFQELTSHAALVKEGEAMRHCVSIYSRRCHAGLVSIWSLTAESSDGKIERKQTIEVAGGKLVVQCRGKCNELPNKNERRAVAKWAKEKHLLVDLGI